MIQFKRILLPTDFSDYAAQATGYACAFANQFKAELHVLHVLHDITSTLPEDVVELAEMIEKYAEKLEIGALESLSGVVDSNWRGAKRIVHATRHGVPYKEIINYAREHDIDLIVMGTHGRSGVSQAVIGSVTDRVVRHGSCPVLTIRPATHSFLK